MSRVVVRVEDDKVLIEISKSGFLWWKRYNYLVMTFYEARTGESRSFDETLAAAIAAVQEMTVEV